MIPDDDGAPGNPPRIRNHSESLSPSRFACSKACFSYCCCSIWADDGDYDDYAEERTKNLLEIKSSFRMKSHVVCYYPNPHIRRAFPASTRILCSDPFGWLLPDSFANTPQSSLQRNQVVLNFFFLFFFS